MVAALALVAAGCGQGPPEIESTLGLGGEDPRAASDAGVIYTQTLERAFSALEDPEAPPVEEAINQGNTQAIRAINQRWEASIRILENAEVPADAQDAHQDLVTSMRQLSSWNQRILRASRQGKEQSRRIGQQAQKSPASRAYGEALQALDMLGYLPRYDDGFGDEDLGLGGDEAF